MYKKIGKIVSRLGLFTIITVCALLITGSIFDNTYAQRYNSPTQISVDSIMNMHGDLLIPSAYGVVNFSGNSGILFFQPGASADTLVNDNIYYNSKSDHSIILVNWCDTMISMGGDSTVMSMRFLGADSVVISTRKIPGYVNDTAFYNYLIIK